MSNLSKFRKTIEKKGLQIGLDPISSWLGFHNLAMNWVCTGSFRRAIPNRRSILVGGESGATKTMNLLQLAAEAQRQGYAVVCMESETSITEQDLEMNGVDLSEDKWIPIPVDTHSDVKKIINGAVADMADEKLFFLLDSINGLSTEKEEENNNSAVRKSDMGRTVQENKDLLKMVGNRVRRHDWYFLTSCHVYLNQDVLNGQGKYIFSNIGSALYYPSLSLQLTKLDLKDGKEQVGIRVDVTTKKTRFFKLGQKVRLQLPYASKGFDKYDGVLDILKDHGYIDQAGAWYSYKDDDGEVVKFQSKNFADHAEKIIDRYEADHEDYFNQNLEMDDEEAEAEANKASAEHEHE